jgi:hypothetical protein
MCAARLPRAMCDALPSSRIKCLSRGSSAELNSQPGMRHGVSRDETDRMPGRRAVPIETAAVSSPTCAGPHHDARYSLSN